MKTNRIALVALLIAASPAWAQAPSPAPGLWDVEIKTTYNGIDVSSLAQAGVQTMMQSMPPDQRKQMEAMLRKQGISLAAKNPQTCLQATAVTDPRQVLAQMQKNTPQCRFVPGASTATSLEFTGRCEFAESFKGDVKGSYELLSDKAWAFVYSGRGSLPPQAMLPGMKASPDGSVEMTFSSKGRWVSADCGALKP